MMARLNLLLLALIAMSALGVVSTQHQARRLYNELQLEQASAKRFEEEIGRLQIEQSFWSTPTRIEKIARERLGMRVPDTAHTRVLGNDPAPRGATP